MTEMSADRNLFRRYFPLVLWMGFIFFLSTGEFSASNTGQILKPLLQWFIPHISDERVALIHILIRKCAHFSGYAVLGILAARAFLASRHAHLRRNWFLVALVLVCLYALSDEFHQSFVPARTGSIYDSLLDIAGGLTALVFAAFLARRRQIQD